MPILDSWLYGNPEDVAARREALEHRQTTACGACIHRRSMDWRGETWNFCANKRRVYGVRCELYETKLSANLIRPKDTNE